MRPRRPEHPPSLAAEHAVGRSGADDHDDERPHHDHHGCASTRCDRRGLFSTDDSDAGAAGAPQAAAPTVTTTTLAPAPTTTTTDPSAAVAADRTQTQGYLNPPLQPSNQFGFIGAGAMEVSVVWSGSTYLTLEVSCPSGNQSVGGTSAMAASLPDAGGNCLATVSEPTSESTSLTYTISIGPAGG